MKVNRLIIILLLAIVFAIIAMMIETGEKSKNEEHEILNVAEESNVLDESKNYISKEEYRKKNPEKNVEEKSNRSNLYSNNEYPVSERDYDEPYVIYSEIFGNIHLTYVYPQRWRLQDLIIDMDTKAFVKSYESSMFLLNSYTEDYDEFLQDFGKRMSEGTKYEGKEEISVREIPTNGSTYKILERLNEDYAINYMVFVKNQFVIYVQATVPRENYTEDIRNTFDKIFATAYISE